MDKELRILILEDVDADAEFVGKGLQRIQKPFTVEGLARKVKDVLKKNAYGSKFLQKIDIQYQSKTN